MRRNQQILNQEAQLNAPDPRESRPPCYEDAILLPRLNGSFASLRKIKSDDNVDEIDSSLANRRNRSRSEEVRIFYLFVKRKIYLILKIFRCLHNETVYLNKHD